MSPINNLNEYVSKGYFYKAVVEDGSDIIFIVDYSGKILYHNPSVKETLGHEPNSLTGKVFYEYIEPETLRDFKKDLAISITQPYQESIEFRFLCSDGTYKYLEFNSINLKHKEGVEGLILDCRDITQRKKDAEELLRAQKAKEQFLANMSHEIRTPINGIAGMANLLSESSNPEDQKKYINAIRNSTENLKVIINDILDISIIESGKLKFEKIGFNVKYQLGAVVDTFIFQCKEKGIDINYSISENADKILLGDPVRLNQILINLISNAVKFTHIGEININVDVDRVENGRYYIKFKVSDTGVGIQPEKIQRIFESFTQADESVTRRYGGTGLGLSIVKQLVELQNGTISVSSEESKGTTFEFIIPYEFGKEQDLVQPSESQQEPTPTHSFQGLRVLLVEDNDINRLYALNMLKKWQCEVDIAENGYIALEKLKGKDFDLILMDVQMPIMDGYETTKSIRSNMKPPKKDIPIIALTANAIKGDNEKCLEVGMNDYLSKPFQSEDLFKMMTRFAQDTTIHQATVVEKKTIPDKIGKIINLEYLSTICNGDKTFMKEMVDTFVQNTPSAVNEMQKWSHATEWGKVGRIAHKIKPSIGFMGISSLKSTVIDLEVSCKENINTDKIPALVNKVESECKKAIKELQWVVQNELKQ